MRVLLKQVLFLVSFLFTHISFSQITAPYSANYISVNGSGSVWAFGEGASNGEGLYYSFNGWNFIEYNLSDGVIAAHSTYGEIHIVNSKGEVLEWNNNNKRWFTYKGISGAKDVFVSKKNGNNKYVLGSVNGVYGLYMVPNISTSAASWQPIWVDGYGTSLVKATNDKSGNIYGVTSSGRIVSKMITGPVHMIGTSDRFAVDVLIGEDGKLYMMERGGSIYKINNDGSWSPSRMSATSWGVDDKGNVYGLVNNEIQAIKNGVWTKISVENPNKYDTYGNTPLTAAITMKSSAKAEEALRNGTDVNKPNKAGDYPIHIAVKNKDLTLINMMLLNKADPNLKDNAGHTPLYYAVQANRTDLTNALFGYGTIDPKADEVVVLAVQNNNLEIVRLLGTKNVNLDAGLDVAAANNNTEMFRTLLASGATINGINAYKKSVDLNNAEIATICLSNGVDKKAAVDYAIAKNNKEMVRLCLTNGTPPSHVLDYSFAQNDAALVTDLITVHGLNPTTVMDKAVPGAKSNGNVVNLQMANIAMQNGAPTDPYFNYAVSSDNLQLVEALLMNGGNPDNLLTESVKANSTRYASLAFDNGAQAANNTDLFLKSVENDNSEITRLFVDRGGNVSDVRLIKAAVVNNNIEITELLISNGAPASDPDLIQTSVDQSNKEITTLLLASGATADNPKLIQSSVSKSNLEMTQLLIDNGATAADPQLIKSAVTNKHLGITKLLLENGAPASSHGLLNSAVENNSQGIVKELLNYGADPNDGIKSAVFKDFSAIAILLLDAGADAKSPALVKAASTNGSMTIVKALVERGAKPDDGALAAIQSGKENVFTYLMDQGANATSGEYLVAAVRVNSLNMSKRLIEAGAPVAYTGSNGENLLHISVQNDNAAITRILVEKGAQLEQKNNNGETPLIIAVSEGRNNMDICTILVEGGANVNASDAKGKSVLKLAKGKKVKDYLKDNGAEK